MGAKTKIEWTKGDDGTPGATWNPVVGCNQVSPGCDHCYAKTLTERFHGPGSFERVELKLERLDLPLRWRKPRRVFVNSMSDLFHDAVPDDYIARVFAVMGAAERHTFQVLTKRHARMRSLMNNTGFRAMVASAIESWCDPTRGGHIPPGPWDGPSWWPLPNVWLGVSVEDQKWAGIRIPALRETPAAVRFLSLEPLLASVDLDPWLWEGGSYPTDYGTGIEYDKHPSQAIDWVIVGGESGRGARPMHPQWARDLRDQCVSAGVPFHFKQWGEWAPTGKVGAGVDDSKPPQICVPDKVAAADGMARYGVAEGVWIKRVGKRAAGRVLDGRTWDEYPDA